MEKLPFCGPLMGDLFPPSEDASLDWQNGLPVLEGPDVTLREVELADAPALLTLLSAGEVVRFTSPPPATIKEFERFIRRAQQERRAGRYVCYAVVPREVGAAIGLVQIRPVDESFASSEWSFVIGRPFWGSGLFLSAAGLVLDFAFDVLGVHRLEARAAVRNGRGNGALRKLGAVCEGVLRSSLYRNGEYLDEHLWSILDRDWRGRGPAAAPTVH